MDQIAATDYYQLFELPDGFVVDLENLYRRYRELQRVTHPDRFAGGTEQERRIALQQASLVNEAYQTLKNPLNRARYLLARNGVVLDDSDTQMPTDFLMEQMELREQLAEVRDTAEPLTELAGLQRDLEARMRKFEADLAVDFARADAEALENARQCVRKMQFIDRLAQEVVNLEEELLDEV